MEHCYYQLKKVPDFSLSKYASLSETGPGGVIEQHNAFWRQMNQWGKLFAGRTHLIYEFDPDCVPGKRMKIILRFDAPDSHAIDCLQQVMEASVISPYYDTLELVDETCLSNFPYRWQVNLLKTERIIHSSDNDEETYYTVSEWEMNEEARLYSMMRLMAVTNMHCAYCVDLQAVQYTELMEQRLSFLFTHLRKKNTLKVKAGPNSVSSAARDENAKKALKFYEDLLENLAASPHFLTNIQVFGESEAETKQILDAAASEALSEGSHELYSQEYNLPLTYALDQGIMSWCSPGTPDGMRELPHLFLLENMRPFATLPVLFPGESIELPKETIPPPEQGMLIGRDMDGHEIYFPWKNLSKHAFLAGMPGSGKTNTMMYLVTNIYQAGVPVLVLEPAKREYRSLTALLEMRGMSLFSPGANSLFPIHINPFEFPKGMKLADHINRLLDVFNGTFELDAPFPMLLAEGIQLCYEELMWLPGMVNTGNLEYPTMTMLYHQIESLLDKYKYADEVRSNLQSVLQVRIGSLLSREMGDIFDVPRSIFPPEKWIEKSAVIELASLGTAPTNFMILMLMTLIRESLDVNPYEPDPKNPKPRHVVFLEEAHNLIAETSVQVPGGMDPKISATAYIKDMLAEVRALGEGIVIADQLPTAMAPEVVKNTSLKIGLRLTSQDERALLGSSMSADAVQMERMGIFTPGRCLIGYEGLLKPFEMQIPEAKGDSIYSDLQILKVQITDPNYNANMLISAEIMVQKYRSLLSQMKTERDRIHRTANQYIRKLKEAVQNNERALGLKEDSTNLTEQCEQYIKKLYRLSLDCILFIGTMMTRKNALESMELPKEIAQKQRKALDEWKKTVFEDFYSAELVKEINDMDDYCKRKKVKIEESIGSRYKKQRLLITGTWKG